MKSRPIEERFFEKIRKTESCWLWTGAVRNGYGIINDGKKIPVYAHRLSYRIANGEIPSGMVVRHRCDNPKCVNPDHLQTGTKKQNTKDMVERGRIRGGFNSIHGAGEFSSLYKTNRKSA